MGREYEEGWLVVLAVTGGAGAGGMAGGPLRGAWQLGDSRAKWALASNGDGAFGHGNGGNGGDVKDIAGEGARTWT